MLTNVILGMVRYGCKKSESIMHIGMLIVATSASGTGLWAAYLWWLASRIPVVPVWRAEPGEVTASMQGWIAAMLDASGKSNAKNARAAVWTGVSVALSGLTTLIGTVSL